MSEVENVSVYDWFDKQTYNDRLEFSKAMKAKGISRQSLTNWISKRSSIPDKWHSIINEYAGMELVFPKVKLIPTLVLEEKT